MKTTISGASDDLKDLHEIHDELRDQWLKISAVIENLEEVNTYEISTELIDTIAGLREDKKVFGKSLDILKKEIKNHQQKCLHKKKTYTGHCHKWDHFKCDECGKEFED